MSHFIDTDKMVANNLHWNYFIIIHDGHHVIDEATTLDKKQYLKYHNWIKDIVLFNEINSEQSLGKCSKCGKPFKLGDTIYNHSFAKHTIVFLKDNLAYFKEMYDGEDSLDIKEQLIYIIHSQHVSEKHVNEYKRGLKIWESGMSICTKIQSNYF